MERNAALNTNVAKSWGPRAGYVRIVDGHSAEQRKLLAEIPLAFLRGLHLKASYLIEIVSMFIESEIPIILFLNKNPVHESDQIKANKIYVAFSSRSRRMSMSLKEMPKEIHQSNSSPDVSSDRVKQVRTNGSAWTCHFIFIS